MIRSGTTPPDRDDNLKEGTILLKTNDIRNNLLTNNNLEQFYHINEEINQRMKSTHIKSGDVLINIVGATTDVVGRTALVLDDFPAANITQAMAFCRLQTNEYLSEYLFAFLNTKFGNFQVRRLARPTGQYNLNLVELGSFQVAKASKDFQRVIKSVIQNAHQVLSESKNSLTQGEILLLNLLALDFDVLASQRGISASVRTLTGSFGVTGRLDAEFWQPAPALVEEKIRSVGAARLGSWCIEPPRRGVQPDFTPHGGVFVVASKAVKAIGIELNLEEATTYEFWNDGRSAKARIQQGDVLLNGTGRGTLGRAGVYTGTGPALADNHVTILRLRKGINPFFVSLFLNSQAGLLQSEKWQAGSSGQLELYPFQIEQFLVPNFQSRIQDELGQYVENSLRARQDSIRLTEIAKRAVEIAIEESETAALHYLETNQNHYSPINSSNDAE